MRLLFFALAFVLSASIQAAPTVGAVTKNADPVGQYRKFELSFPVTTWASNLYDPAQIDIHVTFSGPSGQSLVINAFPFQDFIRSGSKSGQSLSSTGPLVWKCRFAAPATGTWSYVISATDTGGTSTLPSASFAVNSSSSHGFVKVSSSDNHYFNYSDGSTLFPIGENFAWADSKDYNTYYYDDHLGKLNAQGANFVRIWMASWSFGVEGSDTGLGNYTNRQNRAWALDYVLEQMDAKGMVAELCLENHIPYSVSNGWNDNPYNSAIGGPLGSPDQIWTNATAQQYMSRRWRYVTARWGYSTAVMAYEFWNEIENTDNYANHWTDIANWHATNAAALRAASPQQHPLSTSFGYYINGQDIVWPKVDFTQFHQYNAQDMPGMMKDRVPQMRAFKAAPTFAGEFGTDWDWTHASLLTNDTAGWNLAQANWGSLMQGAGAGALSWWWDNLIDGQNQYPRFKGFSAFVAGEDLDKHSYQTQNFTPGNTLGQPIRAMALKGPDKVLGWVENSNSEWYARTQGWGIATSPGVTVSFSGLSVNGNWAVQWWDTISGSVAVYQNVNVVNGAVTISAPQLDSGHPDWAFKMFPWNAPATPTTAPTQVPTAQPTATFTPVTAGSCLVKMAYYPYWNADYRAAQIPFNKLTHINHAFLQPNADGSVSPPGGYLEPALISGAHGAGVKVMTSVGGADSVSDANFRAIAASSALRTAFANSLEAFCRSNGYDGVDIDWEFPKSTADRANLTVMIQAIRAKFNASAAPASNWQISMAVPPFDYTGQFIDFGALSASVNYFNIMGYDSYGAWSSYAGHNASLYRGTDPGDASDKGSIDYMLNTRGISPSKVVLGLPFYGYTWANTTALYQSCNGCPSAQNAYKDIAPLVNNGWTKYWDAGSQVPYLLKQGGAGFISYDDPQSIGLKSQYAQSRGIAGVFMWDLSQDRIGSTQPLLDAMVGGISCGPPTATPTPIVQAVPGRVEAEKYSAFYDTTPGNKFAVYRFDDVDIEACTDAGGGYNIAETEAGEWLEYQIQIASAGVYDFAFRVASLNAGPFSMQLMLDGANLGAAVGFNGTAGWQTWATATLSGLSLPAGRHTLRVNVLSSLFNLNYIDVVQQVLPTATMTPTKTATPTSTWTPSSTLTATPTSTATSQPTLPTTALPTSSSTSTATATKTWTPTATPSWTATMQPTTPPTMPPTTVPTKAPTTAATVMPTPTVVVSSTLKIIQALPVPNPNPTIFYVNLSAMTDTIELQLYSSSGALIRSQASGPHNLGWTIVYLPQEFLSSAVNGTYFYRMVAKTNNGQQSAPATGTLAFYR